MNIGVVTSSWPRFAGDPAGSFVRRAVLDLVALGHAVTVVAPGEGGRRGRVLDPVGGVEVVWAAVPQGVFYGPGVPERLAARPVGTVARLPVAVAGLALSAARVLRDCDALLGHWLVPGGLVCAAIAGRRPFGVYVHSAGAQTLASAPGAVAWPLSRALSRASFVAAPDPGVAARLGARLGREVEVVGPRVELGALLELEGVLCPVQGPLRLGFLGRRVPIKGLERLIEAVAQAEAERPGELVLEVAGPGAPVGEQPWLRDRGVLHGAAAVRAFLSGIDVLVVASRATARRSEGLPCVVLEAWAAGRAVLASDSGGMAAVVPGSWQVSSAIDVAGLARRLGALCTAQGRAEVEAEGVAARSRVTQLQGAWRAQEGVLLERLERGACANRRR